VARTIVFRRLRLSRRLVSGYLLDASYVANLFHLPPISPQLVTAFGGDMRGRAVLPGRFFYGDRRRFFQAGSLHRQVPFGQACRCLEESEIGALAAREYGEYGQAGWFVYHATQIRKGSNQGFPLSSWRQSCRRKDAARLSHGEVPLPWLRSVGTRTAPRKSGAGAGSRICSAKATRPRRVKLSPLPVVYGRGRNHVERRFFGRFLESRTLSKRIPVTINHFPPVPAKILQPLCDNEAENATLTSNPILPVPGTQPQNANVYERTQQVIANTRSSQKQPPTRFPDPE
jgi:hypothetical protein